MLTLLVGLSGYRTKMEIFNEETPNDPNVKYFSYGAEFNPGWSNVFRMSWGIINEREGKLSLLSNTFGLRFELNEFLT